MNDFASAHSAGGSMRAVTQQLVAQLGTATDHTVGFLYVTSPIAGDLADMVTALRKSTGIATWVGTAGHGVCSNDRELWGGPAAAVLTCRFPEASYRTLPLIADTDAIDAACSQGLLAGLGVLHGDPRNAEVAEIIAGLSRATGAYLVGGLTSADDTFNQVSGRTVADGSVSGLLLGGRLSVAVGLTQGCSPIGPVHKVTRCEGHVVATLDDQPAYDVMCADVGIAEGVDPRPWLSDVHVAFPVAASTEADYVVRNLISLDPSQGLVAVAEAMQSGDRLMFVRRDPESASRDMERMLDDLRTRLTSPPKAGLYFSCVARGPGLFEEDNYEMKAIRAAFGDIPIAGFFGNGEIANDRLYGYTGVLTLFS